MAGPRILDSERLSLSELYIEVLYTTLRLRHAPETKTLVADADKKLAEVDRLIGVERNADVALTDGEVQVDWRNYDLDEWLAFFRRLLGVKRGGRPGQELYDRFFHLQTPSEVIRMPLDTELRVVSPWVASLKADSDIDLSKQGAALEALVKAGNDAMAAEAAAVQARRDFHANQERTLFEDINTWRRALYGELSKLDKSKEWVASFYRPGRRRRADPTLTVADAGAVVVKLRAELAQAETELQEAKQRAADEALKRADNAKKLEALQEAKAQDAELKRRIAELEADIAA